MKLVVGICGLAIVYAQLFALWDVLARQQALELGARALWFAAMLVLPVVGTIAYLRVGPGAEHWPPWEADEAQ